EPHFRTHDQAEWIRRLNVEHENLLVALAWREAPEGKPELALRLGGAVWRFWLIGGHLGLGRGILGQLLQISGRPAPRAQALYGSSLLAFEQGDYDAAERGVEECMNLFRAAGDESRVAACLGMLGNIQGQRRDFEAARAHYEEALNIYRRDQNRHGIASQLNN